jgi:hypothetical protein
VQKLAKNNDRAANRTLACKGHLCNLGLVDSPGVMDAIRHLKQSHLLFVVRFRHLYLFFLKPGYFADSCISKVLQFVQGVRLLIA